MLPVACVTVLFAGCAGAPVQELSDTRQTLSAAAAAGAADKSPTAYTQALEELRRAESELKRGDYREAGRQAESAHKDALQALRDSQGLPPAR